MQRTVTLLSFLLLFACIDKVDLTAGTGDSIIVVDGLVTNEAGPYFVKVGRSLPFDNSGVLTAYFVPETNAIVTIEDQQQNIYSLEEVEPGKYKTPVNFQGQLGYTYTLKIRTSIGENIESFPELLSANPPMDSLLVEYIKYKRLVFNSVGDPRETETPGFRISAQIDDRPLEDNFYRWKLSGVFEFFSVTDNPTIKQCWAPFPGKIESTVQLAEDFYFDGKLYLKDLAIIPYDRPTQFLVTVNQYSLTQRAYNFWRQIQQQQESTGSIFDPAPAPVPGNLINIDTQGAVYGFFGASAVDTKSVLINRFQQSGFVPPFPYKEPLPGDCRDHEPDATISKPPGFN